LVAKQSKCPENAATIQKEALLVASLLIHKFGFWVFIPAHLEIGSE
jgi:hypothetical protein